MPFVFQQPAALREVGLFHPLPMAQVFSPSVNGSIYNRFALCPLSLTQPIFLQSMSGSNWIHFHIKQVSKIIASYNSCYLITFH